MGHLTDDLTGDHRQPQSQPETMRLELIQQRLRERLNHWRERLKASGLDGVVESFLEAGAPLGPIGAQLLWIAQPTLNVLLPHNAVDDLAQLLDDPAGIVWLRETLTGSIESNVETNSEQLDT